MSYKLRKDVSWFQVKTIGEDYAKDGDRLGFARYTVTCAEDSDDFIGEVQIGAGCQIKPNAVIGGYGFGFVRDEHGKPVHIYHFGRVIIGYDVWIGSGSCIDRGTIDDTVIGNNTKIDNLVHIAHNCKIGNNVIICCGSLICGNVTIEDGAWIGAGTKIREGITIGKGASTGLGAVVVKDVPAGKLVVGVPARIRE